jgi:hypothetical protein
MTGGKKERWLAAVSRSSPRPTRSCCQALPTPIPHVLGQLQLSYSCLHKLIGGHWRACVSAMGTTLVLGGTGVRGAAPHKKIRPRPSQQAHTHTRKRVPTAPKGPAKK